MATLFSEELAPQFKAACADDIANCLKAFMLRFGLRFGAFDLIQTPSGEYVFLEVNPTGEWGMLERDLEYPICEAICRTRVRALCA